MAESLTGAQSLVRSLESVGAEVVFGIPGGAILPAYDPLFDSKTVRHILVRHEQGGGHAAEGYAQATGKVGVCMATSGPGATNLVTPIADAYMDSVPLVAITGQVPSATSARTPSRRPTSSASPCRSPSTTSWCSRSTTSRAPSPRPSTSPARAGPARCWSTCPRTSCRRTGTFSWPPQLDLPGYHPTTRPHAKQVREAAKLIASAKRPVLYVGGGVLKARAAAELRVLAELTGIPVVTTLMARGAFPDSHPQHLGMPGMHGTVAAVTALQKSDLLICLGARFDDRVTGKLDSFAPDAAVIHADIDPAEIGKNRIADVPIVGDCRETLADLVVAVRRAVRGRAARRPRRLVGAGRGLAHPLPAGLRRADRRLARAAARHHPARPDRRPRGASTSAASASTRCGPASSSATRTPTPG